METGTNKHSESGALSRSVSASVIEGKLTFEMLIRHNLIIRQLH